MTNEPRRPATSGDHSQRSRTSPYSTWPSQTHQPARDNERILARYSGTPAPVLNEPPPRPPVDVRPWRGDELAIKAARARALTDPLGAKGFRETGKRVTREANARRRVFAASVATFTTCFGAILYANHETATTSGQSVVGDSAIEAASTVGNSLAFVASTSTPTPTETATPTATATATVKSGANAAAAKSTSKTPTPEPTNTATATAKPTKTATPEPTATAVPKTHTRTKSS